MSLFGVRACAFPASFDVLTFQMLASVVFPGFTINRWVAFVEYMLQASDLESQASQYFCFVFSCLVFIFVWCVVCSYCCCCCWASPHSQYVPILVCCNRRRSITLRVATPELKHDLQPPNSPHTRRMFTRIMPRSHAYSPVLLGILLCGPVYDYYCFFSSCWLEKITCQTYMNTMGALVCCCSCC